MIRLKRFATFAVALVFALPLPAAASLIQDTPFFQEFSGTGLGAVNTVLTVQRTPAAPSPAGTESGCSPAGTCPTGVPGGDEKTGAGQTGNPTFAELGIATSSQIRVVFNADEPQNGGTPTITLDRLVLTILDPTGSTILAEFSTAAPVTVDTSVEPGVGNAGWVFRLDAAQAAIAAAFVTPLNRVGLGANLSDASGGPETFFVASGAALQASEPGMLVLASGLLGLAATFARRRPRG